MTRSPGVYPSDLFTQSLQPFVQYSLGFPTLALVPAEVSAPEFLLWWVVILSIYLSVSAIGEGSSLPCDLTSLRDLRRLVDLSVCSVSYLLFGLSGDF